ncbi:MAG: acetyl-CoA carboxylase carboxyltransferase subunit alpha [Armatimonadetes bacterium RBG_16_58_9]|nr:MAG: acetyl-CoA carboxylase carboxyltransferase subunit alpha [Armatimonadetes bacterium RBG_16_58_9]
MPPSSLNILDFEKPIAELDEQIAQIKLLTMERGEDRSEDIATLEHDRDRLLEEIFANLTPWDKVLLARHPKRPYTLDYVRLIFDDYMELHGDRLFADDHAMIGGIATLDDREVMFVGQQKGRDLKDRQYRNFGSAKPEGYRKALRLMKLAEKFGKPVICLVDTPAADCGVGSEERGISEAIARNLAEMSTLQIPTIAVVLGEGGSGGALGIAVADRVLMLEHAVYSVIPPESCAAILWRDPTKNKEMAETLKITSKDALKLKVVDEVIAEPLGGAHRNVEATAKNVKAAILKHLGQVEKLSVPKLLANRYKKYRDMGSYKETSEESEPQD